MLIIIWLSIVFNSFQPQPPEAKGSSMPAIHAAVVLPMPAFAKSQIPDSLIKSRKEAALKKWQLKSPDAVIKSLINGKPVEKDFEPLRPSEQQSWLFYVLIVLLFFIAFIRFNNAKEFEELFYIFKPIGINQQLFRDALSGVRLSSVMLNINLVAVIGIYSFLISRYFHWKDTDWQFLCLLVLIITIVLIARFGLLKVAATLFPFGKEIGFYHFNELQINRVLGLMLLPLITVIAFSPYPFSYYALLLSFILIATMLLFRYIRGFVIGREYFARNKFHFLLYICTLEIAPIVIFVKFLKEWSA